MDAFAEDDLIQTFNAGLSGKTVLYISHRLSVAKYADKVLFLSDHTVAGFDNHAQLLNSCPQYREMYYAQAKHYDESK